MVKKADAAAAPGGGQDTANASISQNVSMLEMGASGLRQYSGYVREEWLPALIGRKGMLTLREMRDNDPIIAAIFAAIELLLRTVPFRVEPEDEDNPDDVKAADFVQSCFGDMEHSWSDFIADALSFLQYGFSVYEMVFKFRRGPEQGDPTMRSQYDDGLIGWRKFAGRAQETLLRWTFNTSGDAIAMVQLLPTGGPLLSVPLDKCLHFRTTPYKQNPEGRSVMRSMYNYYFLKKNVQQIEAVGVARDLCGLPVVTVPASWMKQDASDEDKQALANVKDMVNLINQNGQAGLVIPAIYDKDKNLLFKAELLATAGKRQFATTEIINRYDHGMAAAALADFITLGQQASTGSMGGHGAQTESKSDMFGNSVVAYVDIIAAELQRKAVPSLLQLNKMKGRVLVSHGDIADKDVAALGAYVQEIAAAGALVPDATLEAHLRELAGLPAPDNPTAVPDQMQLEADNKAKELEAKTNPPQVPGAKPAASGKPAGGDVKKRATKRRPL